MREIKDTLVLLVDDNTQNLQVLASHLALMGCGLQLCSSGLEAMRAVASEMPDLALLDVMMPDMNGYELCRQLRQEFSAANLPIIFLTAKIEAEDIVYGFEVGANDYITKPFNAAELKARVRNHLEMKLLRDAVEMRNAELEDLTQQLQVASTTDMLTQLLNRRAMMGILNHEFSRFVRSHLPFTLIMSDIDLFKRINDDYGHDCGDVVLKKIAGLLQATLRSEDRIARWGGEEFLVMLPDTGLEGARLLAERMRQAIEVMEIEYEGKGVKVTMTFGVAEHRIGQSLDKTLILADKALYKGKENGRNEVSIWL